MLSPLVCIPTMVPLGQTQIVLEDGKAVGVRLRPKPNKKDSAGGSMTGGSASATGGGEVLRARKGVISNASVWWVRDALVSSQLILALASCAKLQPLRVCRYLASLVTGTSLCILVTRMTSWIYLETMR